MTNAIAATILLIQTLALAQTTFYVSPAGNDDANGSESAPFATIARAQKAARGTNAKVILNSGTYWLDEPLRFGPEDSNVAYEGRGDAIISGGRPISGWQNAGGSKWTVTLPNVRDGEWYFRQLFMDGNRLPRGRFPNGDALLKIDAVSEDLRDITLAEPVPTDLANKNAELIVYHEWSISRAPVESSEGPRVRSTVPVGWVGHALVARPGKVAYLENAPEFVDQPGEWYLDKTTGLLTLMLAEGDDPNSHELIAPKLEQLVIIEGRPDAKVTGLRFWRITFQHTEWPLPPFGYNGIQAGHYGTSIKEKTYVLPGAIELFYAANCIFELGCRVQHTGASGIVLGAGCSSNVIEACSLSDIGGNGIMVGWRGKTKLTNALGEIYVAAGDSHLAADWADPADVPSRNLIACNTIDRAAAVNLGCVGIFDAFASGTRIGSNHVYDLPYTGVSIGFRWSTEPTSQRGAQIHNNHIHDCMKVLSDGGGIYTLGFQPGTIISGNEIHDIHRSWHALQAPNNGIFFDQGSSGIHVESNKIYKTAESSIRFNQTSKENMTWKDNQFEKE
ncbi:MAG TPA: right-handed parallel beta-helix repeat-containing protein [Candidatus Bathyarchaeia archaeon]|nr:right-handed parallel beta-helix repeat-containing protein [Candidatus Bathyarchaeia archaeon]